MADADQRIRDRGQAGDDRRNAVSDRGRMATDRELSEAEAEQRTSDRGRSASDRERAAADRQAMIADRIADDDDHQHASAELRRAQVDPLTGAFGRELGLLMIEREISRAQRGNGQFVLAYVDVNGLKQVNDRRGHSAGDDLLRDVAHAIQAHLRPYDTLVRVGGDEFLCALADCTPATARSRFQEMRATIHQTRPAASISVGLTDLHHDDDLRQLTDRADHALYEDKRSPESTREPSESFGSPTTGQSP
jgi:diguanylate cyclase (GGDEF)-like protein